MFIRTKDNIFEVVEETDLVYRVKAKTIPNKVYSKSKCQTEVIKNGNEITELMVNGDLLIIQDRTTSYPYKEFAILYDEKTIFAYESAIYHLMKLYIRNSKGNYIKAAERKKERLELL